MGGTATASVAARQAHLPLLLHPKPGTALFLGVGTGITLAGAGAHRGLDAVGVELVPEVVQVLRDFRPENEMGPGIRVATGDARRYLRASEAKYDVIIGDLFHPERDGAAWLYTEEHFRAMRDRLASGGVACQWLPWFQLDERSRGLVVAAWLKVFPESDAWLLRWTSLDTPVVGLVHGGKRWSPSDWGKRVPNRGSLQEALRRCGYTDGWQLWGCWVGQASSLPRAMDGENTDDRPAVLWSAAKGAAIARADASKGLLAWLGTASDQKPPWFESSKADGERWDKFRKARDLYLQGLAAAIGGDDDAALAFIWRSVVASTDFPSAYSYLLETAQARGAESPAEGRAILERLARERPDIPVGRELLERMKPKPQP